MAEEFPALAEDFSRYSEFLLNDNSFNQSTVHQSIITSSSHKISKPKSNKTKKHRTKPCTNCRRRKTKCTMLPNETKCVECTKRELDCTYDDLDHNGPVKHTEKSQLLICENCDQRRTKCIIPEGSTICSECSLRDLPCKFSKKADVKIRDDTPVLDYDNYNGPTILRKTLSLQGPKSAQIQSPNANLERNLLKFGDENDRNIEQYLSPNSAYLKNEQLIINDYIKLRKINNNLFFKIVNDNEQLIKLNHSQVDELEKIVYPHGFTLMKLYFKYVHPLIPVLEKKVMFEKYRRSHKEFDPLLLTMLYLHALKVWDHSNLPQSQKPDIDKVERLCTVLYSETFINLIPKFSTCQGLVLLVHYSPTSPDLKPITNIETKDDKWEKLSKLITMVEELGLNYNSDDWITIPNWERKLRKLLAWGIIMFDKFQALTEFKPSKISSNDWILNELNIKDFEEESDNEIDNMPNDDTMLGNLIFVKMIHLSYHANDCLNEIFNLKSMRFDDFSVLVSKSLKLLNNLANWFDSLPYQLKELNVYSNFISTGSLNLSYQLLNFLIYRRIINYFIDNYGEFYNESTDDLEQFKIIFKRIMRELLQFNKKFMSPLKITHLNNCFWYGTKTTGFINIAIVIRLLIKITTLELYIDDEYSIQDLNKIWQLYISKLHEMSDLGDKDMNDVLKHIETFVE